MLAPILEPCHQWMRTIVVGARTPLKQIGVTRSRRDFLRSVGLGCRSREAAHWPLGDVSVAAEPSRERMSDEFIRLDNNENANGPSAKVAHAGGRATRLMNRYQLTLPRPSVGSCLYALDPTFAHDLDATLALPPAWSTSAIRIIPPHSSLFAGY